MKQVSYAIFVLLIIFTLWSSSYSLSSKEVSSKGNALLEEGYQSYNHSDFRGAIQKWDAALVTFQKLGDKQSSGIVIGNLGLAYSNLGDYRKAILLYEKALAIFDDIGDKNGIGYGLSNLGNSYSNLGDYKKAIRFYEKALVIAEEKGDKKSTVNRLGNLGILYGDMGDFKKAISFLKRSLTIAEAIGDKRGNGVWLANLGGAYNQLGDISKAIIYYGKALNIAEEIGDKRGKSNRLGNLGVLYSSLGDYTRAIDSLEKALAIFDEIGDKTAKGLFLGSLGVAYSDLGDYRKAASYYEKAIYINKEIGTPYGVPEGNLADAYLSLDRSEDAIAIYTKQNHPIRLGNYHLKKNAFLNAKAQFIRGLKTNEVAKNASLILPRWVGLGLANEGLKGYEEAYTWYKKTISFMEDQRIALSPAEREHYFEGKEFGVPRLEAYEGAVRCAFMLNKNDESFYWAENTRGRITSELLSSRHSGNKSKIPGDLSEEEDDLSKQIMMNKKQQQTAFEKNNPELLKQLETEYPALKTRMDNLIDLLRKEYPQYAAIKYPQPVTLSQLALKPGETIIEYEVTEPYTIGMVIRDGKVIKSFKVDKTRKELDALVNKFRTPFQAGADINSFSLNQATHLADLLIKPALSAVNKGDHLIIIPDESLSLLPFESLLLAAPAAALREEATILAQAEKQSASGAVDKASIIRGLSKPAAIRSTGMYVAPRVSIKILFDTGTSNISKESGKLLKEILSALGSNELKNASIRIEGHTDSVGDPKFNLQLSLKRARSVYDYLSKNGIPAERLNYTGKGDTEPVAGNNDEKGRSRNRRVDFVRVDSNAANQKARSATPPATGLVYAMDEYPISYYQSASVLSLQRGLKIRRVQDKSFFGLGDPVYDTNDIRSAGMRGLKIVEKDKPTSGSDIATNEQTKDAGYQFGRLVNTGKEIKEVGKLFSNARLFTGADASEEKLKSEDLSSKRYLLFSTHGILGNEIPYIKQPALVLNLVGNDKEDGFLTASEISNMNLNADVVCLSACKTGLGVQSAGEGVVGLSRAFMYAGTDTVLVSLWGVADESTYKLMVNFFEGIKGGKDKMTALKDAKNYLRTNGYANPFYWAPFILMGEAN